MIQFVEQIQRRASIQGNPLCALCEAKRPGYLQMPGAFCVTAFRIRGRMPCAAFRLSSYGKRRDPGSHAFCVFYCLMHNAIGAGVCRFWSGLPGTEFQNQLRHQILASGRYQGGGFDGAKLLRADVGLPEHQHD